MRYPDGGGLTAAERARRERVRLRAAQMYEQDVSPVQVAHRLPVITKPAYQWRRRWRAGGEAALASKGPGGAVGRLNQAQLARLRAALEGGPAAWGWREDQRWTLARVATLIARLFHMRCTLRGASHLLHRLDYSPQVARLTGSRSGKTFPGSRPSVDPTKSIRQPQYSAMSRVPRTCWRSSARSLSPSVVRMRGTGMPHLSFRLGSSVTRSAYSGSTEMLPRGEPL
jgi:transposase